MGGGGDGMGKVRLWREREGGRGHGMGKVRL